MIRGPVWYNLIVRFLRMIPSKMRNSDPSSPRGKVIDHDFAGSAQVLLLSRMGKITNLGQFNQLIDFTTTSEKLEGEWQTI